MVVMVMAMDQRSHCELMLANPTRTCQSEKRWADVHRLFAAGDANVLSLGIAPDASPLKNIPNRLDEVGGRIAENKIRSGNFRRLIAHLQNGKPGMQPVDQAGDFPLLRPLETMTDQGQLHLFPRVQLFYVGQAYGRINVMPLLLQQQAARGFQNLS